MALDGIQQGFQEAAEVIGCRVHRNEQGIIVGLESDEILSEDQQERVKAVFRDRLAAAYPRANHE